MAMYKMHSSVIQILDCDGELHALDDGGSIWKWSRHNMEWALYPPVGTKRSVPKGEQGDK